MTGIDHAPGTRRAALFARRPVLRVALFGISVALAGFTVIASDIAWRTHRYDTARDRATSLTDGTVVEDRYEEHFDLRARWIDATGREHVQRFDVDHRYRAGERFTVAYDPTDPSPRGFPADSGTGDGNGTPSIFLVYAAAAAVVVPLWWAMRGLRFRHAAEQPGRAMVAHPRIGKNTSGVGITHPSTWLILNDIGNPVPYGWQRVMWHPAVEEMPDEAEVIVRGRASASGPQGALVVELPGGIRLMPIGGIRREPPKRFRLASRPGVHVDLGPDGRLVIVRDDPPPPPVVVAPYPAPCARRRSAGRSARLRNGRRGHGPTRRCPHVHHPADRLDAERRRTVSGHFPAAQVRPRAPATPARTLDPSAWESQ